MYWDLPPKTLIILKLFEKYQARLGIFYNFYSSFENIIYIYYTPDYEESPTAKTLEDIAVTILPYLTNLERIKLFSILLGATDE